MPVTYAPMDFWHVVFARTGSAIPKIFPRAAGVTLLGLVAALLLHFDFLDGEFTERPKSAVRALALARTTQSESNSGTPGCTVFGCTTFGCTNLTVPVHFRLL